MWCLQPSKDTLSWVAGLLMACTRHTMLTEHEEKPIAKMYNSTMAPANAEATSPQPSQVNSFSTFSADHTTLVLAFILQNFPQRGQLSSILVSDSLWRTSTHCEAELTNQEYTNSLQVHFKYSYTCRFTSACDADCTACPCGQGQTKAGSAIAANTLTTKTEIPCL